MIGTLNSARQAHGNPTITWNTAAANFAAAAIQGCSWAPTQAANATYSITYLANQGNYNNPSAQFSTVMNTGKTGYVCSTDTCSNSYCPAYRAWISNVVKGFACASVACPVGSKSPWGTTYAWDLVACVTTPYALYNGVKPGGTCPTSNNKRSVPAFCDNLCDGRNCGEIVDVEGCPRKVCGSGACDARATCGSDGICACTPITTCESRQVTCGTIIDNCGNAIICGPANCTNACVPKVTMAACGERKCGSIPDGCGGKLTCGICLEGETCSATGTCISCSDSCHPLGSCIQTNPKQKPRCECGPGYVGDGIVCTAAPAASTTGLHCSSLSWSTTFGSSQAFVLSSGIAEDVTICSISHIARSSSSTSVDGVVFVDYQFDRRGGDTVWAVKVTRNDGLVGLIGNMDPVSGQHFRFYWNPSDRNFYFQSISPGQNQNAKVRLASMDWPQGSDKILAMILRADGSVVCSVDGVDFNAYLVDDGSWPLRTFFGVMASANAKADFSDLLIASSANLSFQTWGCWTVDELTNLLVDMLQLDPTAFTLTTECLSDGSTNITINFGTSSSGNTRSVIERTVAMSSLNIPAIVTNLNGWLMTDSVVGATPVKPAPSLATSVPTVQVTGSSSNDGLSGGQIAGIVVGSVCGAVLLTVLLIGAIIYARRGSYENSSSLDDGHDSPPRNTLNLSNHAAFSHTHAGAKDDKLTLKN